MRRVYRNQVCVISGITVAVGINSLTGTLGKKLGPWIPWWCRDRRSRSREWSGRTPPRLRWCRRIPQHSTYTILDSACNIAALTPIQTRVSFQFTKVNALATDIILCLNLYYTRTILEAQPQCSGSVGQRYGSFHHQAKLVRKLTLGWLIALWVNMIGDKLDMVSFWSLCMRNPRTACIAYHIQQ